LFVSSAEFASWEKNGVALYYRFFIEVMVEFFDLFDVEFTLAGYSLEGVTLANVVGADFEETVGCD
jgi:hypothetical protein